MQPKYIVVRFFEGMDTLITTGPRTHMRGSLSSVRTYKVDEIIENYDTSNTVIVTEYGEESVNTYRNAGFNVMRDGRLWLFVPMHSIVYAGFGEAVIG